MYKKKESFCIADTCRSLSLFLAALFAGYLICIRKQLALNVRERVNFSVRQRLSGCQSVFVRMYYETRDQNTTKQRKRKTCNPISRSRSRRRTRYLFDRDRTSYNVCKFCFVRLCTYVYIL